jgi:hypothetical protein
MDLLLEEICDTDDPFASIGTLALYECRSCGANCTVQTGHDPC